MSTLEEYAVQRIEDLENENRTLKERIAGLEKDTERDATVINNIGTFYEVNYKSDSYYNDIMEEFVEGWNPERLRKCLINPKELEAWMNVNYYRWGSINRVAEIEKRTYTTLVRYGDDKAVLIFSPNEDKKNDRIELVVLDDEKAFWSHFEAKGRLTELVRSEIESYFHYEYDKQFKPKDNGENGED